ncbi:MAG: radical SAM family heme chaperone HemW [Balneolales bacterium]
MSGIYIHIPFCKQACSYCNFYFVTKDELIPTFLEALLEEVASTQSPVLSEPLETIYIGGGTPSRLSSDQIKRLVEVIHWRFDLDWLKEFTVEVNPEDLTKNWLTSVKQLGVTRLSMGIQSFQPELLKFMHRAHTVRQAHQALELLADSGLKSFSVDLIYGSPGQTEEQLRDDLHCLLSYSPPHVSAYSLTIEPKTRLGKQYELGRLQPACDDDIVKQSRFIRNALFSNGLRQYEVSNYAIPGHEAVHNSAYWRHENYLGLGPAAHSFYWKPGETSARRWHNPPDLHIYRKPKHTLHYPGISNPKITDAKPVEETLSLKTLAEERIMMGLRCVEGISEEELKAKYNYTFNEDQKKQLSIFRDEGLMYPENPIRLTKKGFALVDAITVRIL